MSGSLGLRLLRRRLLATTTAQRGNCWRGSLQSERNYYCLASPSPSSSLFAWSPADRQEKQHVAIVPRQQWQQQQQRRTFHQSVSVLDEAGGDDDGKEMSDKDKKKALKAKAKAATAAAAEKEESGDDAAAAEDDKKKALQEKLAAKKAAAEPEPETPKEAPAAPATTPPEEATTTTDATAAATPVNAETTKAPTEYSTPELTADAAKHKAGMEDPERPFYQNPLHHNNPEMNKIFREDFDSDEEFEKAMIPVPPLDLGDGIAAPEYLHALADEIVHLNMLEMNELVNKIADHYGFHEGLLSPDNNGGGADDDDDDAEQGAAAPVEAKTVFDIKLVAFDDKAKIKVIKEVRAIAGLGLKEAKEMVESAPKVIHKGVKQEEADAIKAKLEELGATVEIV